MRWRCGTLRYAKTNVVFILPYRDATVMHDHPVLYETTVYEQVAAHSPRPSVSTRSYPEYVPLSSQVILHARMHVFRRHMSMVFIETPYLHDLLVSSC